MNTNVAMRKETKPQWNKKLFYHSKPDFLLCITIVCTDKTLSSINRKKMFICFHRCSTVGAIIMTPLLTKLLAGQLVPVDAAVSWIRLVNRLNHNF